MFENIPSLTKIVSSDISFSQPSVLSAPIYNIIRVESIFIIGR